jgi:TonB family protein
MVSTVLPGKPSPSVAAPPIKRSLLVRTVASPYVIAVATAALTLTGLHSVGGLLAKRSVTANAGKRLFPPAPPPAPEAPIETSAPVQESRPPVIAVRPAAKRPPGRQPIPSVVLARGARPIRQTSLEYPAEARKERITGTVEMQVTIAEDGSVQSPRMVSGDPLLQAGLAEAISKWVYQPMRVNGKPVPMTTELAIKFNLSP